jgi:hypothetical protein
MTGFCISAMFGLVSAHMRACVRVLTCVHDSFATHCDDNDARVTTLVSSARECSVHSHTHNTGIARSTVWRQSLALAARTRRRRCSTLSTRRSRACTCRACLADGTRGEIVCSARLTCARVRRGGLFSRYHVAALLVGIAMAVALALTGINAVMFFAPQIFEDGGYSDIKTPLTIALGAVNFVATVIGILMYRVIARRIMLVGGLALLSGALVLLAVCRIAFTDEHWAQLVATVCVFVFVVGFAVGPGLSFWPIVNTYYHPAVAAQAAGLLNLLQWGENLVLALVFPPFAHAVGGYAFLPFAVIGVLTTGYIAVFLKSPAQIVARG